MMENKSDDFLNEVMDLFMDRYQPVGDISEATHFLTTDEIHKEISRLNPGSKVKPVEVYQMLRDHGYRYDIEKDHFSLSFKWMLKEK